MHNQEPRAPIYNDTDLKPDMYTAEALRRTGRR
jgi:hypothetical protein